MTMISIFIPILVICVFLFCISIFLLILKRKVLEKSIKNFLIILLIVSALPICFTIFMFSIFSYKTYINNSQYNYDYAIKLSQLNENFSEIYSSNKRTVIGINLEVIGYVNGKGKLFIYHPPYEIKSGIELDLEENIEIKIENRDWYNPECLIKYIPENEYVEGNITIILTMK